MVTGNEMCKKEKKWNKYGNKKSKQGYLYG